MPSYGQHQSLPCSTQQHINIINIATQTSNKQQPGDESGDGREDGEMGRGATFSDLVRVGAGVMFGVVAGREMQGNDWCEMQCSASQMTGNEHQTSYTKHET